MNENISTTEKIVSINDLTLAVKRLQKEGKRIVHCHGCFDFLHLGHLRHFKEAKAQGDILIVTVTMDQYINKGPERPFYTVDHRVEMLAALEIIDYICINPWPTAAQTIETIGPDIFVKGAEYSTGNAQQDARFQKEVSAVKKTGGAIYFTDDIVFSSSKILNDLLEEGA